jgi:hypothetical protein
MKLLCDQMLGSLATWLRILGQDTYYAQRYITDDELLQIAKNEQRTIISRDKVLLQRAKKELIQIIPLVSTNLDEQLRTVLPKITIDKNELLTRCTICNTILESIIKNRIIDQVPKRIYDQHDTFWYCPHCNKVYWMGSHYENIRTKLQNLTMKSE